MPADFQAICGKAKQELREILNKGLLHFRAAGLFFAFLKFAVNCTVCLGKW